MSKKNMTLEQKEALMKAKQEQRQLVEKISQELPGFSTNNLMGVKKRLIPLKAAGADMYRIRCFGRSKVVVTKWRGRLREISISTMNAPAFNKFASILLVNKEMLTWFNLVAHDPTWEAFWTTIKAFAMKRGVLENWSAAEWMVARNRYKDTVELVNQLSVKFLGKEMTGVKYETVEVTALFNKETYYFRLVTPQAAWEECRDINSRYFPNNHPGRFCVGDGVYQHQMKTGKYHGYIVDKTIDAKTNSYKDGNKFSFGFVLITSLGVCDWGFGPQNRVDGPEEQLAKAVFGTDSNGGLQPGCPEQFWIQMIMNHWFDMRKMSYNQWVTQIETRAENPNFLPPSSDKQGYHQRLTKNQKPFLEYFNDGHLQYRIFLNERSARFVKYHYDWAAGAEGFYLKPKVHSNFILSWYLQAPKASQSNKRNAGTLWEAYMDRTLGENYLPWELSSWRLESMWENQEFYHPHLAGLTKAEFEAAVLDEKKQNAVFSIKTKDVMTLEEVERQIQKFNEVDFYYDAYRVKLTLQKNGTKHNKSKVGDYLHGIEYMLLCMLITQYGYRWMKTPGGYMLVSSDVAWSKNAHRIMTSAECQMLDLTCESRRLSKECSGYYSHGILMPMADEIVMPDGSDFTGILDSTVEF